MRCPGSCAAAHEPKEAYRELGEIKDSCQYKRELKALSYAFIAVFFGVVLGGSLRTAWGLL